MTLPSLKRLPVAAAALLLAAAGNASAGPYAYAYNNIFGLRVFIGGPVSINSSTHLSNIHTSLNGASLSTGGSGLLDAPQAALGAVSRGENDFTRQGPGATFVRGDAQIVSTQLPPFPAGSDSVQAVVAAEAHLHGPGYAHTEPSNGSLTGIAVNLAVGAPGTAFFFDFRAYPYLLALLGQPGDSASAALRTSIRILDAGGAAVFSWAPDGALGSGIHGGTEMADDLSLNRKLSGADAAPGGAAVYDPAACGEPGGSGIGTACGGRFTAVSDSLAAGNYMLVLDVASSVDVFQIATPGTLALLGLGLAGLAIGSRRRPSAFFTTPRATA